jgi:hypothetical protein
MYSFLIIDWQKESFLTFRFLKYSISTGTQRRNDEALASFRNKDKSRLVVAASEN